MLGNVDPDTTADARCGYVGMNVGKLTNLEGLVASHYTTLFVFVIKLMISILNTRLISCFTLLFYLHINKYNRYPVIIQLCITIIFSFVCDINNIKVNEDVYGNTEQLINTLTLSPLQPLPYIVKHMLLICPVMILSVLLNKVKSIRRGDQAMSARVVCHVALKLIRVFLIFD